MEYLQCWNAKSFRFFIAVSGLAFFTVCFYAFATDRGHVPTDRELVKLFRSHQKTFEQLSAMAMKDMPSVSYLSLETLDHNTLRADRRKQYADLLSAIR